MDSNVQYLALARKYRPQNFDDVVGQEHVIQALKNSISQNRIHHAYLLTGTRGIGKTTIARIIAKCLECETGISVNLHSHGEAECKNCAAISNGNFPDVIEIDAASQTKVDDTRQILENTMFPPMIGRFKIYIIDEVHMLSNSSFNALLKTLEEPPEHVKFILATTDPHKIPKTVLSRCLQFQLKALSVNQIENRILDICSKEAINCEKEGANLIARAAKGSMRDALSLCDQAVALGQGSITRDNVISMLGTVSDNILDKVLELLTPTTPLVFDEVITSIRQISPNYKNLLEELVLCFHDLALYQMIGQRTSKFDIFATPEPILSKYARIFRTEQIQTYYQICLQGLEEFKLTPDGYTSFEMSLLRMLAFTPEKKKIG